MAAIATREEAASRIWTDSGELRAHALFQQFSRRDQRSRAHKPGGGQPRHLRQAQDECGAGRLLGLLSLPWGEDAEFSLRGPQGALSLLRMRGFGRSLPLFDRA